jgi:hypothetical protein
LRHASSADKTNTTMKNAKVPEERFCVVTTDGAIVSARQGGTISK